MSESEQLNRQQREEFTGLLGFLYDASIGLRTVREGNRYRVSSSVGFALNIDVFDAESPVLAQGQSPYLSAKLDKPSGLDSASKISLLQNELSIHDASTLPIPDAYSRHTTRFLVANPNYFDEKAELGLVAENLAGVQSFTTIESFPSPDEPRLLSAEAFSEHLREHSDEVSFRLSPEGLQLHADMRQRIDPPRAMTVDDLETIRTVIGCVIDIDRF